jgi:hypothetical protein
MKNKEELKKIFKGYFDETSKTVLEKFNIQKDDEFEELLKYLKEFIKISQEEFALDIISKLKKREQEISQKIELHRKEFLEYFEKNLQNIGFISKKSRNYSAETDIGKLYKYLINKKNQNIYIESNKIERESFKEQDLYDSFKNILNRLFNNKAITIYQTANVGISGTWVNPDILVKFGDYYYSYELKRWKNISPIAPHEARNHARYISNYPYVVINVPQTFFEFVIEYTDSFQIIKNDCKERGIGLILFDDVNNKFLKLLDANYFTPDPLKKLEYEKEID